MLLLWLSEVDCGSPAAFPYTHILWNESSRMGTKAFYQCITGYHNVGKGNTSVCTASEQWEDPSVICEGIFINLITSFWTFKEHVTPAVNVTCLLLFLVEILCGSPPVIDSTEQVWDSKTSPGSSVHYVCKVGFYSKGGQNISVCNENGQWTLPTLSCQGKTATWSAGFLFFSDKKQLFFCYIVKKIRTVDAWLSCLVSLNKPSQARESLMWFKQPAAQLFIKLVFHFCMSQFHNECVYHHLPQRYCVETLLYCPTLSECGMAAPTQEAQRPTAVKQAFITVEEQTRHCVHYMVTGQKQACHAKVLIGNYYDNDVFHCRCP